MDINQILKMAGISNDAIAQLMGVKSLLDKLPKEKQAEVMGRFIEDLQNAVKENGK